MLESNVGLADYQCQCLLGDRYHRLDPVLPSPIALGEVDQMPRLKELTVQDGLMATLDWLARHF